MCSFKFSRTVRDKAFFRQYGKCAWCGGDLSDVWDEAHHVIPQQSGNANDARHKWLRSVDNCVILCDECHHAAHEFGRYKGGATPFPQEYVHAHGGQDAASQSAWLSRVSSKMHMF